MYDYLIVGAGLFGSVFAHEATRRGKSCLVAEKRGHTGGNAYTKEQDGIIVHEYGAHIFHTASRRVWDYVNSLVPFDKYTHRIKADYMGKRYSLPFNMNTFRELWGVSMPEEARKIIASQSCEDGESLEKHAISIVGRDVYEYLIKGYTEKQWGRSPSELPAGIIKRIPLRFTFDDRYFSDEFEGIPQGGYTRLIEKLLEGCDVRLDTDYLKNREALSRLAEKTVYTGALDEYFCSEYGALSWRSLRFEKEEMPIDDFQGAAVINYTDAETPFTRIIEHKHFMPRDPGSAKTIITREYPAPYTAGAEKFYPIADKKSAALAEKYAEKAKLEKNVIFGGRLGTFSYLDMDKVVLAALSAAEAEFGRE
ncbi:MAG: UDP-galactopyranose mutase [Eubacteriales bacterium]|nr:UDP-galactopyranose mutase [Eubacteriales bacterium]MDD4511544.1 UDP-galactopyranose mutase [Eubacteriales bacterium]